MDRYPAFSAQHARERISPSVPSSNAPGVNPGPSAQQVADDFVVVDSAASAAGPSWMSMFANALEIGATLAVVAREEYREYRASEQSARAQPASGNHCTRCGHSGHDISTCYAKRNAYGRPVSGRK